MQVKVLKKAKNELEIELTGETHTFCNVLQKALLQNKRVDIAGYNIPHPLTASPVLYIRTKTRSKPEVALKKALKEVEKTTAAFQASFEKALNEWQS
jgi:DNA-directed RNA polymerase subunit L